MSYIFGTHIHVCAICGATVACSSESCSEGPVCGSCAEEAEMLANTDFREPYLSDIFAEIAADRQN